MSSTRWLFARQWRGRVSRWLLVVVIAAVAVSPIVGVVVELNSAAAARRTLARQLAGPAPLRVVGSTVKGGLTPSTLERVRNVPNVASVVPTVQAITEADGIARPLIVLGVDCSAQVIVGNFGCTAERFGGLDAPVLVTPRVRAAMPASGALHGTGGRVDRASLITSEGLDRINDGYVALTGLSRAQELFARGQNVDVAYIEPAAGASIAALREALARLPGAPLRVLAASDPPPGPDIAGQISALLAVVGILGLVVGWLLVRSITRLALAERAREIAIATAVGRPASATATDMTVEACGLGIVGGALGCLGGLAAGALLVGALDDLVGRYSGTTMALRFPLSAALVSVVLALAMVAGAMLPEGRRATKIDVAQLLGAQQAAFDPPEQTRASVVLALAGVLIGALVGARLLTGRAGLASWAQPVALLALVAAVISAFALAAATMPIVLRVLARALRPLPRAGLLARDLAGQGRRVTSISLAVTFAVGLATVLAGLTPAMRSAAYTFTARNVGERLALNVLPFNDSSMVDAKIGPELITAIAAAGGTPVSKETFILTRVRPGLEVGVMASQRPNFGFSIISGRPAADVLAEGRAVIGAPLARALGIGPNDMLVVDAPDGEARIVVGAVSENINNAGMVAVVPDAFVEKHWGWQPPDPLLVGNVDGPPLSGAVRARLQSIDPRLRVESASQLGGETSASIGKYLLPFEVLRDLLLVVVAVAAFITLLLDVTRRRREYALLEAVGVADHQLRSIGLSQAAMVSIVGAVQGVIVGIILSEPLRDAASFVVGIRPPLRVGGFAIVVACTVAVLATLVASLIPSYRLRSIDTSDALRAD